MSCNGNRKRPLSLDGGDSLFDNSSGSSNDDTAASFGITYTSRLFRSVNHYPTEQALKNALLTVQHDRNQAQTYSSDRNNQTIQSNDRSLNLPQFPESAPSQCSQERDRMDNGSESKSSMDHVSDTPDVRTPCTTVVAPFTTSTGATCDWLVPDLNSDFIHQSMENEIRRLLVLKSYEALDEKQGIPSLNKLAALAGRVFNCANAYVTLMDLGLLFLVGRYGLNVEHVPRKESYCSFTILVKNDDDVFVLVDTQADERTRNFPYSSLIRFYAGTPLTSPEGLRLGTFCVLDNSPRPHGLSLHEKDLLRQFSSLAVDALVTRKTLNFQTRQVEKSVQILASAANDLLTPLTGVQLSLSLLREDICSSMQTENSAGLHEPLNSEKNSRSCSDETKQSSTLGGTSGRVITTPCCSPTTTPLSQTKLDHRLECLATATTCANIMLEICETLRPQNKGSQEGTDISENLPSAISLVPPSSSPTRSDSISEICNESDTNVIRQTEDCIASLEGSSMVTSTKTSSPKAKSICHIPTLAKRLKTVMEAVPKQVPVVISVDPSVPNSILADELPIFRMALNLLAGSCDRASTGKITLTITVTNETNPEFLGTAKELLIECIDAGPPVMMPEPSENENDVITSDGKLKMKTSQSVLLQSFGKSTLSSVSSLARSMGGDFGIEVLDHESKGLWKSISGTFDSNGNKTSTRMLSVSPTTKFWFKIPLFIPEEGTHVDQSSAHEQRNEDDLNGMDKTSILYNKPSPQSNSPHPENKLILENSKRKRALVIDDSIVIRKTLSRALTGLGYDCVQAEDGLVGLRLMKSDTFHVVLCDFLMPVMDGMDCVREYREWENSNRPFFHQFIVGMSAHATTKDAERAVKIGMNKYIPKPIFLPQLKKLTQDADCFAINDFTIDSRKDGNIELKLSVKKSIETMGLTKQICLIGARGDASSRIESTAIENGFFALTVDNGEEVEQLLKARNWMIVLIDESIVQKSLTEGQKAVSCISRFRDWEKQNRVHRQKNVYLMSPSYDQDHIVDKDTTNTCSTLMPFGVDGILGNPVSASTLSYVFHKSKEELPFVAGDIVTS